MDVCMSQVAENIHLWLQLGRRRKGKTTEWTILSESYNKACHIRATMLLVAALPCNKDEDNHKIQEWQRESSPEPVRFMEGTWKTRLCIQYVLYGLCTSLGHIAVTGSVYKVCSCATPDRNFCSGFNFSPVLQV